MNVKKVFFIITMIAVSALLLFAQEDPLFWRQAIGGEVMGIPAAQAGSVVMVGESGNLRAYSWEGKLLWSHFVRGRLLPFVTRSREGTSYICDTNGILIAINRVGRELWRINLGEVLAAPVLIGWDGRIFSFTAGRISCFTASGNTLWIRGLEKKIALAPQKDGEGGFFLVLEDGELLWGDAFGGLHSDRLETVPAAAVTLKLKDGPSLLFFYPAGNMEIFDMITRNREALTGMPEPIQPLAAASLGSYTAVLLRDGNIHFISMEEQKILWSGETHLTADDISAPDFEAELLYDEEGIYLLTKSGAAAFTDDGRRLWLIRIKGAASLPAFSDEGVLYSGGLDWILYAYKLEERVKAQTGTLYGPVPEGSYGTGIPHPELFTYGISGGSSGIYLSYDEVETERYFTEIGRAVQEGRIGGNEKEYAAWLMNIAGNSPAVFIRQRMEAVRLLSYIGSRETVPFLVNLFTRDGDPLVKAAAAEAIGRIGVDPEGIAIRAFSNAIFPPSPMREEHVLASIASATGALCLFSGPPLSQAGVRILTALAGADRPPPVRNRAEQEIRNLAALTNNSYN